MRGFVFRLRYFGAVVALKHVAYRLSEILLRWGCTHRNVQRENYVIAPYTGRAKEIMGEHGLGRDVCTVCAKVMRTGPLDHELHAEYDAESVHLVVGDVMSVSRKGYLEDTYF